MAHELTAPPRPGRGDQTEQRPSPLLRIVPPGLYAGRARMLVERSFLVNRRSWLAVVSGFFEPLFFLFALGLGFGTLVSTVTGPDGQPMDYVAFVAPALLAASAMNGAVYDATINIFHKMRYAKLYDAVLSTPLGPLDVAVGETSWALLRGGLYAAGFVVVLLGMGLVSSAWGLLALPAALLVAFAFAAVGMAATTFMRSWQDFDLVNLAVMPLFLFSTTFYPLSVYPRPLRIAVECLPLYHGVALLRGLVTGYVHWGLLGHVLYLVLMAVVGLLVATKRIARLLLR
ncbi:ABC transporter permease [Goodfellowiella coeruleoviolacea]|uniref:Transport permease protein n=1 Tax=Goodfellowiella coeruleoviolacea TaxID=334858 RepID=A0AAE3KEA3_9PSEU|nr:ABC transporter permease [Goodfellowiella coeruleoviolacea]MCP2165111.1 lipooligosaccharide transport system permease protein [Goodfellowiella coeruleoviolacea]